MAYAPELLSLKFLIFYAYLGCVLYVHLRSRVRLSFLRQLVHHSGLCAPYNVLMYLFSAVPSDPILEVDRFPQLKVLRENWRLFREEALALYEKGKVRAPEKSDDLVFINLYRRGWKRFHLKWYGDFFPSAEQWCPRSVEVLRSVPEVRAASFTLLPAGGTIGKHRDPLAGALRYHLGLVTPNSDQCRIWIDGEPYTWRDGEDIVFDETYMHWARNDTEQDRIILFCDVERPLRTRFMRTLSGFMNRRVFVITQSGNTSNDPVGGLNRLTPLLGWTREALKSIKNEHRTAYKVAQRLLLATLVYLVFVHGMLVRAWN